MQYVCILRHVLNAEEADQHATYILNQTKTGKKGRLCVASRIIFNIVLITQTLALSPLRAYLDVPKFNERCLSIQRQIMFQPFAPL